MNAARLSLKVLMVCLLAACAAPPKIESLQGESLPSVATGASTTITFTILDARPQNQKAEESIDTSLGVGKRIDETLISPPPIDSFRTLLHQALLSQDYKQGTASIVIQEFGVGTVKGRGVAVNVFGNPGAQGAAAGAGSYGLPAMLIVQLFEQARQDSKAFTYIATMVKLQFGETRMSCDGVGSMSDANASQAWQLSVRRAATDCAAKLLEAVNTVETSKPITEIAVPVK